MRVTQILNACGLRQWPECVSRENREYYLDRGSKIHLVTELYDRGQLDESTVDERIKGFLEAWKSFRKQIGGKLLAIEKEVKHRTLGYQGRLDRILGPCAVNKRTAVMDIKTNDADVFTRLQLSGYRMALPRFKKLDRMSVSLFENGKYKVRIYDDSAKDDKTWVCCVALASWLQRNAVKTKGE